MLLPAAAVVSGKPDIAASASLTVLPFLCMTSGDVLLIADESEKPTWGSRRPNDLVSCGFVWRWLVAQCVEAIDEEEMDRENALWLTCTSAGARAKRSSKIV